MPRSLPEPKPTFLRVGVTEFPPFVEYAKHDLHGFEVSLWQAVARRLDVHFEYKRMSLKELIRRAHRKQIDVGFAGISKTEAREEAIDFTHTTYKSGLHILIPATAKTRFFASFIRTFREQWRQLLGLFFGFGVFVAIMGHLIWYLERGHHFATDYAAGVGDGIWYTLVTISTVGYGDLTPVTFWGRMLGGLLIIVGYAVFALLVAQLNSIFVYQKLQTAIQEPSDLKGKRVVTVRGTVSEDILDKYHPILVTADTIHEALHMLEHNKADALVFDAPVLQHYLKLHGKKRFRIVGTRFEEHDYGMILPEHSPWRDQINRMLLHLIESGEYDALYRQWFRE